MSMLLVSAGTQLRGVPYTDAKEHVFKGFLGRFRAIRVGNEGEDDSVYENAYEAFCLEDFDLMFSLMWVSTRLCRTDQVSIENYAIGLCRRPQQTQP